MPSLAGINHQRAIKAFEKAGFQIVIQGKHITMTDGENILTIPRLIQLMPIQWEQLLKVLD